MGRRQIKLTLPEVFQSLFEGHPDREKIFENLIRHCSKEDINFVYEACTKRADVNSFYWLIRYLVSIERPYGYQKIIEISKNNKEYIYKQAFEGIKKININQRIEILMSLLEFPGEEQKRFASCEIAACDIKRAVPGILTNLKEPGISKELIIDSIKALGELGESRTTFLTLSEYVDFQEPNISKEAVRALEKLIQRNESRMKLYLESTNRNIREIAYMYCLNYPKARNEKYIVRGIINEKENRFVGNILAWIREIYTENLFNELIKFTLYSESMEIRMMAESALKRIKTPRMFKYITKKEKIAHTNEKLLIIRLLSEYKEKGEVNNFLMKLFKKSKEPVIKIEILNGLVNNTAKEIKSFLKELVLSEGEYSYMATIVFSQNIKLDDLDFIEKILLEEDEKHIKTKEVLLGAISRADKTIFSEKMWFVVLQLLDSKHASIMYMAALCLSNISKSFDPEFFARKFRISKDIKFRKILMKSLMEIIKKESGALEKIMEYVIEGKALDVMYPLFKRLEISDYDYKKSARQIIVSIPNFMEKNDVRKSRLLVILRRIIKKDISYFLDYLRHVLKEKERWIVVKCLNSVDVNDLQNIDVGYMAEQYEESSNFLRLEYLIFFKKLYKKDISIENVIYKTVNDEDAIIKKNVYELIKKWSLVLI